MSKVILRSVKDNDYPQILKIMNYEVENETALYRIQPFTLEEIKENTESVLKRNDPYFIACHEDDEDTVLGHGYVHPWNPKLGYRYTTELTIYLDRSHSGKGIGSLMMRSLMEACKGRYRALISGVCTSNKASIALHKKFNFEQVGFLKNVGFKFGKWLDVHYYEFLLTEQAEIEQLDANKAS
mmetsp:Transcript_4105/g.6084  ORF Transcript_4105/g.6084 Transcript_4105/m.6084 type:complete len:183 (+) Transcript_4105:114-662(+)